MMKLCEFNENKERNSYLRRPSSDRKIRVYTQCRAHRPRFLTFPIRCETRLFFSLPEMQSSSGSAAQPEAILEWLRKEMGYRPLGPYSVASGKSQLPSTDSLRKICRRNMISVWNFLIARVKSEKTVENIRRNITVHGGGSGGDSSGGGKEEGRSRGRRKEKAVVAEEGLGVVERGEAAWRRKVRRPIYWRGKVGPIF
jgi:hypothetical protein